MQKTELFKKVIVVAGTGTNETFITAASIASLSKGNEEQTKYNLLRLGIKEVLPGDYVPVPKDGVTEYELVEAAPADNDNANANALEVAAAAEKAAQQAALVAEETRLQNEKKAQAEADKKAKAAAKEADIVAAKAQAEAEKLAAKLADLQAATKAPTGTDNA